MPFPIADVDLIFVFRWPLQEDDFDAERLADIDRALSHLEACLAGVSSADLEKTLSIFKDLVVDASLPPALQMDSLFGLAISLGVTFVQSKGRKGLQEFLEVKSKMLGISSTTVSLPYDLLQDINYLVVL